eukprot:g4563.t1
MVKLGQRAPGFASVCEGFGGFRFVNGVPGEPPVRPNLSIGDTLAGMNAVLGILLALLKRGHRPSHENESRGSLFGREFSPAHWDAHTEASDIIVGTVISWPSDAAARETIANCNQVEGFRPNIPEVGVYRRSVVDVMPTEPGPVVKALIYHQFWPEDALRAAWVFPRGDWLN